MGFSHINSPKKILSEGAKAFATATKLRHSPRRRQAQTS
ncbi:hypothetical protein J2S37_001529 [Corynebacterium felinum]|uniref:Uncharacterized protein n=1 Tax=Corynebacterium felinum TaxID=131318 RepID=A0ABU2B8Q4_9CORY|nr:hypothetical protein [Corynebacterium felinum]